MLRLIDWVKFIVDMLTAICDLEYCQESGVIVFYNKNPWQWDKTTVYHGVVLVLEFHLSFSLMVSCIKMSG